MFLFLSRSNLFLLMGRAFSPPKVNFEIPVNNLKYRCLSSVCTLMWKTINLEQQYKAIKKILFTKKEKGCKPLPLYDA